MAKILNNLLTGLGVVFVAIAIMAILWGVYELNVIKLRFCTKEFKRERCEKLYLSLF